MNQQLRSIILRKMWLIATLLPLFLAGAVFLLMISKGDLVLQFQDYHTATSDQVVWLVNLLGDGWFVGAVAAALLLVSFRSFFVLAFSSIITSVVVQVCKRLVYYNELRPSRYFEEIGVALKEVPGIELSGLYSFPSGHTAAAFAMFVSLALLNKNKLLGLSFLALAIAVGFARVYLGQHFYVDVYFGALIGSVVAFIVYIALIRSSWFRKWWTRKSLVTIFKR